MAGGAAARGNAAFSYGSVLFMRKDILSKLVSKTSGRKRSSCAIVIPSADSIGMLERHLGRLAKQDSLDFDVIIIGKAPRRVPARLNILTYSENYPLGSSGGFGIGQVLAYSLGYEFVINSDVDASPVSEDLVRKLQAMAKAEGKSILPHSADYKQGRMVQFGGYVHNQYGICTRQQLETFGFEYFRFFKGSEDVDYHERMRMEGIVMHEDSIRVEHKNHLFDYVSLLKWKGNKYAYYKKSAVLASILLSRHCLGRVDLAGAAMFYAKALLEAVKTSLFYAPYPDITGPVLKEALRLDMKRPIIGRTTALAEASNRGKKPVRLSLKGEEVPHSVIFDRAPRKRANRLSGSLKHGTDILLAIAGDGDYFCPTNAFLSEHGGLLPLLMQIKPLKYSDGKTYSTGMNLPKFFLNAIWTALLMPLFAVLLLCSINKAGGIGYPITIKNLDYNLEKFLEYVQNYRKEEEKLRFSRS